MDMKPQWLKLIEILMEKSLLEVDDDGCINPMEI